MTVGRFLGVLELAPLTSPGLRALVRLTGLDTGIFR
jgi:hypothetical protein